MPKEDDVSVTVHPYEQVQNEFDLYVLYLEELVPLVHDEDRTEQRLTRDAEDWT